MPNAEDVFVWRFTAFDKKAEILDLRELLIEARENQTSIEITRLFDALPISTPQRPQAEARGEITVTGSEFTNISADELWMEFTDPAMGQFFVTVPPEFRADVPEPVDSITITFAEGAEIGFEVPKIEELGVKRSKFQLIREIEISDKFTITRTEDEGDPGKKSEIFVLFEQEIPVENIEDIAALFFSGKQELDKDGNPVTYSAMLAEFAALGVSCNFGVGDGQWYVLRRRNDGVCFVHDTNNIPNTEIRYQGSKDACEKYFDDNCPDTYC